MLTMAASLELELREAETLPAMQRCREKVLFAPLTPDEKGRLEELVARKWFALNGDRPQMLAVNN